VRSTVAQELRRELERMERCDEVLTILLHHHRSQSKPGMPPVSKEWHKDLADKISDVLEDRS